MVLLECGFHYIWAVLFLPFMLLDVRRIVGAFYSILGRVSCGHFSLRNFRGVFELFVLVLGVFQGSIIFFFCLLLWFIECFGLGCSSLGYFKILTNLFFLLCVAYHFSGHYENILAIDLWCVVNGVGMIKGMDTKCQALLKAWLQSAEHNAR
ncbi:hypothetical protein C2G38_2050878 [Gigaspora rosea]|uniref:Uncharacterized protein n=1 Tax=Gigaspora rosea TaxID=44941 RepID=A0A397TTU4_9GLOM|nr:hypothetical protein C2G38_2050878 [Gigaspora rosea]